MKRRRRLVAPLAAPLGLVLLLVLCSTEPPAWALQILAVLVAVVVLALGALAAVALAIRARIRRPPADGHRRRP